MIKIIPPGSFSFDDPVARLVDVHSRGVDSSWMQKRAAVLTREIADLRPEPNHSMIHLISMGAMEAYGHNRNADAFNEKAGTFRLGNGKTTKLAGGLMEFHPTFMKYGHVYKHHKNDDPAKSIGEIKAAAYNPDMRRGELIISVPHNLEWEADLQKLASGKDIPFSMACKVAYDICTECGNRGRTRKEYCDHLRDHMCEITKEGNFVGAINDMPGFFDISKVVRPADRIAWSLQKVAGLNLDGIGGAELAELMEVYTAPASLGYHDNNYERKLAAADKMAEIEKQVDAMAQGKDNQHLRKVVLGAPTSHLKSADVAVLKQGSLSGVLRKLAEAGILLDTESFFGLVMGSKLGSMAGSLSLVDEVLPGLFNRLIKQGELVECAADTSYDSSDTSIPRHVRDHIDRLVADHSIAYEPTVKRATRATVRGESQARLVESGVQKQAAASNHVNVLAKEYAKYCLSFVKESGLNDLTSRLTVLRNYLSF